LATDTQEKLDILKTLVWDYNVNEERLLEVLLGTLKQEGPFDQTKILLRVLERLPWHTVLDLISKEYLTELLDKTLIAKLRFPEQKRRYERIRKILHGEPLSFSGWDPLNREAYKRSLLSNRWYRTK